jgi:L-fucose mutarotase/ribose pyranase (RbsD/FucU family)
MCYNKNTVDIKDILAQKRETVLKRWLELILDTYPADVANFLRLEKDRFANPIGHVLIQGTEILYDALLHDNDPDTIKTVLDDIIRIRAVQDFMPSQAIAFVFLLKQAIREEAGKTMQGKELFDALSHYEVKIDTMALCAFDVYERCREEIHNISTGEIKKERDMAMRLSNILKRPDKQ